MGYDNTPYKPGTPVYEIELSEDTMLVRVYDGEVLDQFVKYKPNGIDKYSIQELMDMVF
ncbi:hypothetical protein KP781_06090 [Streptococcus equi subsp. zooepidemicus]|uniref:hypothetical protein n=1 Tax=Streptococcus equi TaxID=1336 RepID=UPI00031D3276|nr:hypothetical protein [Streptococcus equi]MCD3388370.1 hypothetical protein [Streptococcus equi subsp. zooepidemicus]MCD3399284.1 hypothetical protein [Streptococcus equi subsp. zooepidemicus]MCD3404583.1 hypothetical protein [Streptococcus equi subsp. zooepidemicus]MCD3451849.1 hypothetical protein [Streptococcus equi subsp. zooepidemicus]MCD3460876.1 hypothetical protein [Streptococcus equi subsp. zooepidemicus]